MRVVPLLKKTNLKALRQPSQKISKLFKISIKSDTKKEK